MQRLRHRQRVAVTDGNSVQRIHSRGLRRFPGAAQLLGTFVVVTEHGKGGGLAVGIAVVQEFQITPKPLQFFGLFLELPSGIHEIADRVFRLAQGSAPVLYRRRQVVEGSVDRGLGFVVLIGAGKPFPSRLRVLQEGHRGAGTGAHVGGCIFELVPRDVDVGKCFEGFHGPYREKLNDDGMMVASRVGGA